MKPLELVALENSAANWPIFFGAKCIVIVKAGFYPRYVVNLIIVSVLYEPYTNNSVTTELQSP